MAEVEQKDTRHLWPRFPCWGGGGEGSSWALDRCLYLTEVPSTPCSFPFQIQASKEPLHPPPRHSDQTSSCDARLPRPRPLGWQLAWGGGCMLVSLSIRRQPQEGMRSQRYRKRIREKEKEGGECGWRGWDNGTDAEERKGRKRSKKRKENR